MINVAVDDGYVVCRLYHDHTLIQRVEVAYPNWIERLIGRTIDSKVLRVVTRLARKQDKLVQQDNELKRVAAQYTDDVGNNYPHN